MKSDIAEFHENLSIHFNLNDNQKILTTTLHKDLHAVLDVEVFHSLRMPTLYHALDQHASSENYFYHLKLHVPKMEICARHILFSSYPGSGRTTENPRNCVSIVAPLLRFWENTKYT